MERTIIAANDLITIEYLPDRHIIYHTVHKPICGQPLRDALNAGAEFLRQNRVTKWLSDDRKNGPLPREDAEWGFNDWNKRMIDAGWKYWANVVPSDVASAGTLAPVINDLYNRGLRMMVFTTVEDALAWLDKMK